MWTSGALRFYLFLRRSCTTRCASGDESPPLPHTTSTPSPLRYATAVVLPLPSPSHPSMELHPSPWTRSSGPWRPARRRASEGEGEEGGRGERKEVCLTPLSHQLLTRSPQPSASKFSIRGNFSAGIEYSTVIRNLLYCVAMSLPGGVNH